MIERPQTMWTSGSLVLLLALFSLLVLLPLFLFFADTLLPADADRMNVTRDLLRDGQLQHAVLHTLAVALLACGLASMVAVPAAFLAVRMSMPVRILIQIVGVLPLTMPPFLSAAALRHFTGTLDLTGVTQSFSGLGLPGPDIALILVFALHYLPFVLFSLIAGLSRIDRSAVESARNLGAGPLLVWHRVTLPLATPAYVLGASLVLLRIFEDIGTPLILGVDGMLAPELLSRLGDSGLSDPLLQVSALVLFGMSLTVAALGWSALAQAPGPTSPGSCTKPIRWNTGPGKLLICLPLVLGLGMLTLAPHLWLILMAVGTDWADGLMPAAFDLARLQPLLADTLAQLDVTLAFVAGAGILTLLVGSAWGTLSWQRGTSGRLTRFSATSLFAVPGVVLALAYAHTLERFDLQLPGWPGSAWLALMLVVALKQLPLAERIVAARLRVIHQGALESARNLGATRLTTGLRVGLPALAGVFGAAFLIGCAAAVVELSAALLLIQGSQAPLALSLFRSLQLPAETAAGPVQGLLLIGFTGCVLLLLYLLLRQHCRPPDPSPPRRSAVTRKTP